MEKKSKSGVQKWMRLLHRDIGFLMIGLTIVYCVSGIVLTFRNTDFLKHTEVIEKNIAKNLNSRDMGQALHLRNLKVLSEDENEVVFEGGSYDKTTGTVVYESKVYPVIIDKIDQLHKTSSANSMFWFNVSYGILLGFLALSSLWMYNPKSKPFKRGITLSLIGIIATVVLVSL